MEFVETQDYLIFHIHYKILVDIDFLFRETNRNFLETLKNLNLSLNIDFRKRFTKRLYTHEFLKSVCEYLKTRNNSSYTPYFFSNTNTKDDLQNQLIQKFKNVFGFKIWEYDGDLSEFAKKLKCNNVEDYEFHIFLSSFKKPKSFKSIKKYLQNTGLDYMDQVYLEDLGNKMRLLY